MKFLSQWFSKPSAPSRSPSPQVAMRLCLSIQRHELPVVRVLWHASNEKSTVAQLLEQINEAVPLEAEGWGIEDYVASVRGFECLHWQVVRDVLKEDDELCIAPLQTSDVRARTRAGRYQISSDGKHLIDGIAFGRTWIKKPSRPSVQIPPRKRQRLDEDEDEQEVTTSLQRLPDGQQQLWIESHFDDADVEGLEDEEEDDERLAEPETSLNESGESKKKKRKRSVQFDEDSLLSNSPNDEVLHSSGKMRSGNGRNPPTNTMDVLEYYAGEEDDEEDDDFAAEEESLSDSEVPEESEGYEIADENVDEKNAASNTQLFELIDIDETSSDESDDSELSSESSSSVSSSSVSSDSVSSSESEESDSEPDDSATLSNQSPETAEAAPTSSAPTTSSNNKSEIVKSNGKPATTPHGSQNAFQPQESLSTHTAKAQQQQTPPGAGKLATKKRNERRKNQAMLKRLISRGALAPTATPEDVREWLVREQESTSQAQADLESRRQDLLESIAAGGVEVDAVPSMVGQSVSKEPSQAPLEPPEFIPASNESTAAEATPARRSRLDLASSRRLLFGSLGLRTPKNKADEEALKDKLKTQGERKPILKEPTANLSEIVDLQGSIPAASSDQEDDDSPEAWKSKIELSAVECTDTSVSLSTPPFPFVQHWDRQKCKSATKKKQRKRNSRQYYEEDDSMTHHSLLNYDGEESEPAFQTQESPLEDDLPPLPTSMLDLPPLSQEDIAPGAVLAYKQLEVSQATNWQPAFSPYRTAIVTDVSAEDGGDNGSQFYFKVQLAKRDCPSRAVEYDDEGNRIYGKFEMPGQQDEQDMDDETMLEVSFDELVEPKLVKAAMRLAASLAKDDAPTAEDAPTADDTTQTSIVYETQYPEDMALRVTSPNDTHGLNTRISPPVRKLNGESASAEDDVESIEMADVQAAQLPATLASGMELESSLGSGSGSGRGGLGLVEASA